MVLNGPVVALVQATTDFILYSEGVFSCDDTTNESNLNHAITVVGYDADGNFIAKNSWGKSWGVNGFMNLSKDNDCGLKLYTFQFENPAHTLESPENGENPLNPTPTPTPVPPPTPTPTPTPEPTPPDRNKKSAFVFRYSLYLLFLGVLSLF